MGGGSLENPCRVRGESLEGSWKTRGGFVEGLWGTCAKFIQNLHGVSRAPRRLSMSLRGVCSQPDLLGTIGGLLSPRAFFVAGCLVAGLSGVAGCRGLPGLREHEPRNGCDHTGH